MGVDGRGIEKGVVRVLAEVPFPYGVRLVATRGNNPALQASKVPVRVWRRVTGRRWRGRSHEIWTGRPA